jgi:hypothetical protein
LPADGSAGRVSGGPDPAALEHLAQATRLPAAAASQQPAQHLAEAAAPGEAAEAAAAGRRHSSAAARRGAPGDVGHDDRRQDRQQLPHQVPAAGAAEGAQLVHDLTVGVAEDVLDDLAAVRRVHLVDASTPPLSRSLSCWQVAFARAPARVLGAGARTSIST